MQKKEKKKWSISDDFLDWVKKPRYSETISNGKCNPYRSTRPLKKDAVGVPQ